MISRLSTTIKRLDWTLFSAVLLLTGFGLVEIYSIALGRGGDFLNFQKQLAFIGLGIILMLFIAMTDYAHWRGLSPYLYIAAILLLLAVLLFGTVIRGTKGWFQFGPINLQPVELAKIAVLAFLSRYFTPYAARAKNWANVLLSGIFLFVPVALIITQPDLGSALILISIWLLVMFFAGVKFRHFAILTAVLAITAALAWSQALKPYQKERILTFLNPKSDALGRGYNVTQATIAVGSGGLIGRGVGFGSQSQLKFLPEAQNDFIFAVIAEELGFLGVFLVLILFSLIIWRLLKYARQSYDPFGAYFLSGAAGLIFIQMFVNISMNIGLLPVIGISLPFLSYGGSAIVSFYALIGIAQSIIIRNKLKY